MHARARAERETTVALSVNGAAQAGMEAQPLCGHHGHVRQRLEPLSCDYARWPGQPPARGQSRATLSPAAVTTTTQTCAGPGRRLPRGRHRAGQAAQNTSPSRAVHAWRLPRAKQPHAHTARSHAAGWPAQTWLALGAESLPACRPPAAVTAAATASVRSSAAACRGLRGGTAASAPRRRSIHCRRESVLPFVGSASLLAARRPLKWATLGAAGALPRWGGYCPGTETGGVAVAPSTWVAR